MALSLLGLLLVSVCVELRIEPRGEATTPEATEASVEETVTAEVEVVRR